MQGAPAVSDVLSEGNLRTISAPVVINIETPPSFYANLEKMRQGKKKLLLKDITVDLSRFLNKDSLDVFQRNEFRDLLKAVQDIFRQVVDAKGTNFKQYPSRKDRIQL